MTMIEIIDFISYDDDDHQRNICADGIINEKKMELIMRKQQANQQLEL